MGAALSLWHFLCSHLYFLLSCLNQEVVSSVVTHCPGKLLCDRGSAGKSSFQPFSALFSFSLSCFGLHSPFLQHSLVPRFLLPAAVLLSCCCFGHWWQLCRATSVSLAEQSPQVSTLISALLTLLSAQPPQPYHKPCLLLSCRNIWVNLKWA